MSETLEEIRAERDRYREALAYVVFLTEHLHGLAHVTGCARAALAKAAPQERDGTEGKAT